MDTPRWTTPPSSGLRERTKEGDSRTKKISTVLAATVDQIAAPFAKPPIGVRLEPGTNG